MPACKQAVSLGELQVIMFLNEQWLFHWSVHMWHIFSVDLPICGISFPLICPYVAYLFHWSVYMWHIFSIDLSICGISFKLLSCLWNACVWHCCFVGCQKIFTVSCEVAFLLQLGVLMGGFRVPNFLPQKWLYGRGIPKPYSSIRKFNFYIPKSQLDEIFWMLIYLSPMDKKIE